MTVNCIHTGPLYFHIIPKHDPAYRTRIRQQMNLSPFDSGPPLQCPGIKKTAQPLCRAALAQVVMYVQGLMFQHCSSKVDESLNTHRFSSTFDREKA